MIFSPGVSDYEFFCVATMNSSPESLEFQEPVVKRQICKHLAVDHVSSVTFQQADTRVFGATQRQPTCKSPQRNEHRQ